MRSNSYFIVLCSILYLCHFSVIIYELHHDGLIHSQLPYDEWPQIICLMMATGNGRNMLQGLVESHERKSGGSLCSLWWLHPP